MNDGISQSQEIVKHAKSVVKCELHVSKLVCVCVHAWTEQISSVPNYRPHYLFLLLSPTHKQIKKNKLPSFGQ